MQELNRRSALGKQDTRDRMRQSNMRDGRPSCALGFVAMLRKTLRTNYRRKLAHVVVLADGAKLVTLRDAANVLLDVLGSVNARSSVPDNATRLLLIAAKTGKHHDVAAATEAVERVIAIAGLCQVAPDPK